MRVTSCIGGFGAVTKCLPKRFQEYDAKVVTPLRTIQQIVNPPQTDTATSSWTAAGVDPSSPNAGLLTKKNISSGTWFTGGKNEVVVWFMNDTKLNGVDGNNGTIITTGGTGTCTAVPRRSVPIAVKGRIVVGGDGHLCSWSPH